MLTSNRVQHEISDQRDPAVRIERQVCEEISVLYAELVPEKISESELFTERFGRAVQHQFGHAIDAAFGTG